MNDLGNFFNNGLLNNDFLNNGFFGNSGLNGLDINKLLVIILLLTDQLQIEAIHVYRNNFAVTLGTFIQR